MRRNGYTLIEILVAIAIITVLIGLLAVAIVRVREASARTQSSNNVKQIILAAHHFAQVQNGRLPTVGNISSESLEINGRVIVWPETLQPAFLVRVLPYIDQVPADVKRNRRVVRAYVSPADPTAQALVTKGEGVTSYAVNAQAFKRDPRLPGSFADGISTTIALGEHYARCDDVTFYYWTSSARYPTRYRPAFADVGDQPVTSGDPPISGIPGSKIATFQLVPPIGRCAPGYAQTPHSGGMLIAMVDGSVRQISGSVSSPIFWALVTPSAGDTPGTDW
jgi:prepilin-type N-terminal cleavage/methylation domain-containing protein